MHDDLIVRTPDKMIDYLDGYILLAFRDSLIYFKVSNFGVQEVELSRKFTTSENE